MGGVQSSAHSLGDALWMHERQRQRGQRESAGGRYESQEGHATDTEDRRKLLKRTRSLAVISEDHTRKGRETSDCEFHLGRPDLELQRRPQLIPRAKLIDRNSLKDRKKLHYFQVLGDHPLPSGVLSTTICFLIALQTRPCGHPSEYWPGLKLLEKVVSSNFDVPRLSKSQQHLSDSYERFNESRSYHSHSTCDLYSAPSALSSLPDPPLYGRTSRGDPDRLNILDWPRTPRRYRSHQDLDTVSGLVEIVEDNWPIDDNRSLDSIHTQVKRKRKGHRSLDSILHEDDDELEYFDVLNLLPLSKVRLEFNESDARSAINSNDSGGNDIDDSGKTRSGNFGNFVGGGDDKDPPIGRRRKFVDREIRHGDRESSEVEEDDEDDDDKENEESDLLTGDSSSSEFCRDVKATSDRCDDSELGDFAIKRENYINITDEEKCKNCPKKAYPEIVEFHGRREDDTWRTDSPALISSGSSTDPEAIVSSQTPTRLDKDRPGDRIPKKETPAKPESPSRSKYILEEEVTSSGLPAVRSSRTKASLREVATNERPEVEEAEDYKSIWISDSEAEPEDMSRRPQVLRVVDNEVTSRRRSISSCVDDENETGRSHGLAKERNYAKAENYSRTESRQRINPCDQGEVGSLDDVDKDPKVSSQEKSEVETARDFFERKSLLGREAGRNRRNEGRFERIVKGTSNILGKACSAVRGSLGFEARSESSDLGLGSDCGSDTRRRSIDDGVDEVLEPEDNAANSSKDRINRRGEEDDDETLEAGRKSRTNLTRSRSCVDSIESQNEEGPEFDHVRYKIVKSRLFGKNMYGSAINKRDVTYDGLMEYLREYSFQELLMDNNVVIIEPVRAETIERKSSNKDRPAGALKGSATLPKRVNQQTDNGSANASNRMNDNSTRSSKQSSLRKHFFYQPIRVNKELIDEELPDPDTVRNVRRMFEKTLRGADAEQEASGNECKSRKSASMKDLRRIEESTLDDIAERAFRASSRSRCSSRAKDLTKLFEDKTGSSVRNESDKGDEGGSRGETKTRILAQSFEARSGNTSPSETGSTGDKMARCRRSDQACNHHSNHQQQRRRQLRNWDAGSVSSGVSSDYPDTDPGSGAHCTSSSDEDTDSREECSSRESDRVSGHFVSQDVLRKIRECGTSVTYYGGKVVNMYNGPLISPTSCKLGDRIERSLLGHEDYVKFRLVKSNSCDSRLELTGRVVERRSRLEARGRSSGRTRGEACSNLRESTIAETPSIEITTIDSGTDGEQERKSENDKEAIRREMKREPPVVIGLEPKKDDSKDIDANRVDFKLGKIEDSRSAAYINRFGSALTRWQINETNWKRTNADFGKMEFEEFEVLEDSLNDK